jgi:hypothetical protein
MMNAVAKWLIPSPHFDSLYCRVCVWAAAPMLIKFALFVKQQ